MSKSLKELIENAEETIKGAYEKGYSDGLAARDAEIVRCKDCRCGRPYKWTNEYVECVADVEPIDRDADFFCAYGKRRE